MSDLGTRLREARERQGLSLTQVALDTRILQQSLVALEEGAFQRLPGDVVIRGFIRNYAQYLGLNPDEMVELYRSERGVTDPIRVVPVTKPPSTRAYVLPSFFGVFFVTIALIGMSYITLNAVGRIGDRVTPIALAAPTATVPPPSPLPTSAPTLTPLPQPTPTPRDSFIAIGDPPDELDPSETTNTVAGGVDPDPVLTPTPAAPITIELVIPNVRGNENSWVRVQTDGNTAFEGVMRAGEHLNFSAQRRVLVRAGNPPDVLVTVNGIRQGALGPNPGQPVDWPWPPN
ncbi:helix-turn-helix domain-containing protein [Candidatus Viridilinea mediisalina]|uniref:DNA-binding protein n=1 Tax=Candidatus Viridilinea mediisalina TaxID=2024553 RepID=A0A2A6RJF0_9CHLR|nr:RodZ domain-containing protein [Candidatus Viridilinea mediisalina]PDW03019.1 DNA-binding protein [Candidatus Viridilinea mediisalina]